jgi:hypothetical protein
MRGERYKMSNYKLLGPEGASSPHFGGPRWGDLHGRAASG